ncbi:MAG: hypothetical protein GY937_05560 [bacterium]|nr:hypothetical protein [bacterium]
MFHALALLATFAICSWIALDLLLSASWRQRIACVAALAISCACWVAGELLLLAAVEPSEVLAARQVLFLGICLLGPTWLWSALEARSPGWTKRRALLVGSLLLPSLAIYSMLYWDSSGLFVDGTARPARHGPLFAVHAVYSWSLIAIGLRLLLTTPGALGDPPEGRHRWLLVLAVLAPLGANFAYLGFGPWPIDPTPLMLGFSALALRSVVLHVFWGPYYLPFSRTGAVEQMEKAFLVADHRGLIVDANPAAHALLGHVDSRSLADVVSELERRPGALEPEGFWLRHHGQVVGAGLVIADRTEQRRLEHELETTVRLEAIGHLAAGVAHEVNNPLTYLIANLSMLEPLILALADSDVAKRLPREAREIVGESPLLLAESREGADRIRRIVAQMGALTDVSDKTAGPRPLDLRAMVDKACAMANLSGQDAGPRITGRDHLQAVAVEADVQHILLHLLLNARQAAGPKGEVEVRLVRKRDWAVVRVLDDGPGIPEKDLAHLFDPFFTTRRPERLGLGLSLSWRLARRGGGRIEVANRINSGAAFSLWVPFDGS